MAEITNEINVTIVREAGFMGRAHSSALALVDLSGLAVRVNRRVLVEPNAEAGRAAAQDLHWREPETDWRVAVERDDIHVADIVTPPGLHEDVALAAIRSPRLA